MTRPLQTTGIPLALCGALLATTGCLVRHRNVAAPAAHQARPLLTASKDELVARVHAVFDPISSFVMRADLSPSVLDPSKGAATDYATVSAYLLYRKPGDIRILGQDPVISSTIFDMVSNGSEFRVSIPRKKRFVIGRENAPQTSSNKLENLRPSAILDSLLIHPDDPAMDVTVLENDPDRALYILLIIRRERDQFVLARSIQFDRYSLQIVRQQAFDASGNLVSDTRYADWKNYGDVPFPSEIDIQRPKDNYEVQLGLISMRMNAPDTTADKFVLEQPPDTQLQELK